MNTGIDVNGLHRRTDYIQDDQTEPLPASNATTERADRAAAFERYEALVSSGCGDTSTTAGCIADQVPHPVLFTREGTDADAVDLHDVRQDGLGDCFLMAPLAGLARTPEGRALIKSAVAENKNDKGDVVSYSVTLHRPDRHSSPTAFRDVTVTVTGPFVCGHATPRTDGNLSEVWPLVIEKAYAQCFGFDARGGSVADAMEVLTGREATRVRLDFSTHLGLGFLTRWLPGYPPDRLSNDLAAKKIVVLETNESIGGYDGPLATQAQRTAHIEAHKLFGQHAYVVTGTEEVNGRLCLILHNPWNERQPDPVPYDELGEWFASVNIASVTP
jgi:hypothetical protein